MRVKVWKRAGDVSSLASLFRSSCQCSSIGAAPSGYVNGRENGSTQEAAKKAGDIFLFDINEIFSGFWCVHSCHSKVTSITMLSQHLHSSCCIESNESRVVVVSPMPTVVWARLRKLWGCTKPILSVWSQWRNGMDRVFSPGSHVRVCECSNCFTVKVEKLRF